MLCNGMAGMMTHPIVAKYSLSVGADLTTASAIAGMMSLVALAVCPFAGLLCDKGNRKHILIAANFGYGLSLVLHCVCVTIPALIAWQRVCFFLSAPWPMWHTPQRISPKPGRGKDWAMWGFLPLLRRLSGP